MEYDSFLDKLPRVGLNDYAPCAIGLFYYHQPVISELPADIPLLT